MNESQSQNSITTTFEKHEHPIYKQMAQSYSANNSLDDGRPRFQDQGRKPQLQQRKVNAISSLGCCISKKQETISNKKLRTHKLMAFTPRGKRKIDPVQLKGYKWNMIRLYLQLIRFFRPDEDSHPFLAMSVLEDLGIPQPTAWRYLQRFQKDGLICLYEAASKGKCNTYIINVPQDGYLVDVLVLDELIRQERYSYDDFVNILKDRATKPVFEITDLLFIDLCLVNQIPEIKCCGKNWRIPCPCCDDSLRPVHRSHGYFSEGRKGNIVYFCHKCHEATSLSGLLKKKFPELHQEWLRLHREHTMGSLALPSKPADPLISAAPEADIEAQCNAIIETLSTHGICVQDLPRDHPARVYLDSRKIDRLYDAWFVSDYGALMKCLGQPCIKKARGSRLVWIGRDKRRRPSGYISRTLEPLADIRWVKCKVRKSAEGCIYIPEHLDLSIPVYVCEGIPDAIGMQNAITAQGTNLTSVAEYLIELGIEKKNIILIWDNERMTNPQIDKWMSQAETSGWKVMEWNKGISYKDINDMVVAGASICNCLSLVNPP